ncbi:MAG TPA: 2-dehydropantoate 2-reductase N-terminal domain-containing protein [Acidimicrobiia bacterium]|nr:2-dehydropantoate 2-reductase N-terminal domain-containing protein [Acidimicrobiia bacterium]
MRFVVYGAGAIGGVVGARLAQHGHDVLLVARGTHLDAIRAHGLRLQAGTEDVTLPIPAAAHAREIDWREDDVVLLATKSQDTLGVALALAEDAPRSLPVVSLQNGVANEPLLLRWFPNVYAVCVMSPTAHLEPGVVQAYSVPVSGLLDIGRYPHGLDDTARAVAAALASASFESIPRPDIMRWKYTKLLMNLGNAIEATCAPSEAMGALAKRVRNEGRTVLRAAGIDAASSEEDRERRGSIMTITPIEGSVRGGGSSWQSLARGTGTIESDYLNGEIVWLGRLHGVQTPANELVRETAVRAAREHLPPGSFDAHALLDQLPAE